jgi:hypothetical protein
MSMVPGQARNIVEIAFWISLQSCPQCGWQADFFKLQCQGPEGIYAVNGPCPRCGKLLAWVFRCEGDPRTGECRTGELGGERHSVLISPGTFLSEIGRLLPEIVEEPSKLPLAEWRANRDATGRALKCVVELAKFLPEGAVRIPESAIPENEREALRSEPLRLSRGWIETQRERLTALRERIVADLPRIDALEEAESRKRRNR